MLYNTALSEPLRLSLRRTRTGWTSATYRERQMPELVRQRVRPLLENDWFKQGGAVFIRRTWREASDKTYNPTHLRMEEVKGRVLGLSRNGKVWTLVYFNVRASGPGVGSGGRDRWWELRLVDPNHIEPLDYGIEPPPDLPDVWAAQLPFMSFDKQT